MTTKDGQLSIPSGAGSKKVAKKIRRRKRRRDAQKLLDEAPKKDRFRGYS